MIQQQRNDWSSISEACRISRIEWAQLPGQRARHAGKNARLNEHGQNSPLPLVRVHIDGTSGFGWSRIDAEEAKALLEVPVRSMFAADGSIDPAYRSVEFALLDWQAKRAGKPVYELFAAKPFTDPQGLQLFCYDTSLYFDDLHLQDDSEAVKLIQQEAEQGAAKGHRHFKLKVGRGARHMPLDEGTRRDIAIIRGVREVAGPTGRLMIDANNGYNLNLTKTVLRETAEQKLYWIEEAFHEDPVLYGDLKHWMSQEQLNVLIADGEGHAAGPLVDWALQGAVDVLQYDILRPGFSFWLELLARLSASGKPFRFSPHSYGSIYGNFATGHLALAADGFQMIEWDDIKVEGLDGSAYRLAEGKIHIPRLPGFGLELDEAYFTRRVGEAGWSAGGAVHSKTGSL